MPIKSNKISTLTLLFLLTLTFGGGLHAEEPSLFSWAEGLYQSGTLPEPADYSQTRVLAGVSVYRNQPNAEVPKHGLFYVESDPSALPGSYYFEYIQSPTTLTWSLEKFVSVFQGQKKNFKPLTPSADSSAMVSLNVKGSYYLRKVVSFEGTHYLVAERLCELAQGCDFPFSSAGNVLHHYQYKEVVDYSYYNLGAQTE